MGILNWFKKTAPTNESTNETAEQRIEALQATVNQLHLHGLVKDALMTANYQEYEAFKNQMVVIVSSLLAMYDGEITVDSTFIELVQDKNFNKRLSVKNGENGCLILKLVDLEEPTLENKPL